MDLLDSMKPLYVFCFCRCASLLLLLLGFLGFFNVCEGGGGGLHYNFINVLVKNPEKGTIRFNDK